MMQFAKHIAQGSEGRKKEVMPFICFGQSWNIKSSIFARCIFVVCMLVLILEADNYRLSAWTEKKKKINIMHP